MARSAGRRALHRRSQAQREQARRAFPSVNARDGLRLRPADALDVDPQPEQQQQRHADVQEHEQREQAIVHSWRPRGSCASAARRTRAARSSHSIVAMAENCASRSQASQKPPTPAAKVSHSSGTPLTQENQRKPLKRPAGELAHQVQDHHQHEGIGGVAVQAANDATEVPLRARQVIDRAIRALDRGVEHRVQIDAAGHDDPEQQRSRARPDGATDSRARRSSASKTIRSRCGCSAGRERRGAT